jgi:hypothetical protein
MYDIRFEEDEVYVDLWFLGMEASIKGVRTDGARCQICGKPLPLRKKLWCCDACAKIGQVQAEHGVKKNKYGFSV